MAKKKKFIPRRPLDKAVNNRARNTVTACYNADEDTQKCMMYCFHEIAHREFSKKVVERNGTGVQVNVDPDALTYDAYCKAMKRGDITKVVTREKFNEILEFMEDDYKVRIEPGTRGFNE